MFKLHPNPTFTAKVQITVAEGPPAVIDVTFKHKGRTALAAFMLEARGRPHAEVLAEIIADWSGPLDDKGEPVPYGEAALAQLVDNYGAAGDEMLGAYGKALLESRVKN